MKNCCFETCWCKLEKPTHDDWIYICIRCACGAWFKWTKKDNMVRHES